MSGSRDAGLSARPAAVACVQAHGAGRPRPGNRCNRGGAGRSVRASALLPRMRAGRYVAAPLQGQRSWCTPAVSLLAWGGCDDLPARHSASGDNCGRAPAGNGGSSCVKATRWSAAVQFATCGLTISMLAGLMNRATTPRKRGLRPGPRLSRGHLHQWNRHHDRPRAVPGGVAAFVALIARFEPATLPPRDHCFACQGGRCWSGDPIGQERGAVIGNVARHYSCYVQRRENFPVRSR